MSTRSAPLRRRSRRATATVLPVVLAFGLVATVSAAGPVPPPSAPRTYVAAEPVRLLSGAVLPAHTTTQVEIPRVPDGASAMAVGVTAAGATTPTRLTLCPATQDAVCDDVDVRAVGSDEPAFTLVELGDVRPRDPTARRLEVRSGAGEVAVWLDVVGFAVPSASGSGSGSAPGSDAATGSETRWLADLAMGPTSRVVATVPDVPDGASAAVLRLSARDATRSTVVTACPVGATRPCGSVAAVRVEPAQDAAGVAVVPLGKGGQVELTNDAGDLRLDVGVRGFLVPGSPVDAAGSVVPAVAAAVAAEPLDAAQARVLELPVAPPGASGVAIRVTARGGASAAAVSVCPGSAQGSRCDRAPVLTVRPGAESVGRVVVPLGGPDDAAVSIVASHALPALGAAVEDWVVGAAPLRTGPTLGAFEAATGREGGVDVRGWAIDPDADKIGLVSVRVAGATTALPADRPRADLARAYPEFGGHHGFAGFVAAPPGAHEVCVTAGNVGAGEERALGCREVRVLSASRLVTRSGERPPDAQSTGVPAGTPLTRHDGDLVITEPGTVVDALDVHGVIRVEADDVVIRNSRVRGRAVATRTPLVSNESGARNLRVVDSELAPDTPSPYLYGVMGWNFTLERVNIHHVVDSVHSYGSNVTIRSSWLHDNVHYRRDPNFGFTPSHDDGVQIQGGSGIRIVDSRIDGAYNAAIQITQDVRATRDVHILGNWLDGGGCTVNVAEKFRGPIRGLVIGGNRFGRGTRLVPCAVIAPGTTPISAWDNRFTDGGHAGIRPGA